eukprot:3456169-Rhodomonas_salina.16
MSGTAALYGAISTMRCLTPGVYKHPAVRCAVLTWAMRLSGGDSPVIVVEPPERCYQMWGADTASRAETRRAQAPTSQGSSITP